MNSTKRGLSTAAVAFLMGTGALTVAVTPASARVVCNSDGDCWHTDQNDRYPRGFAVQAHPADWYFHQKWNGDEHRHFRDYHEGRGYYRGGNWVPF